MIALLSQFFGGEAKEGKSFFFEKKKQKTFDCFGSGVSG
jgi:hypothetical protein